MGTGVLEKYRTDAPEKCIRALLGKHRKVWVDGTFETKGQFKLQKSYIADLPIYYDARGNTKRPLSAWEAYGGIVLNSFTDSLFSHTPPVPALLLLECPLNLQKLSVVSMPAYEALVIRIPKTWRLHEMVLAERHPGRVACEEFHAYLLNQHQRMTDEHAAMAQAMGHDINDVAVISADEYSRYEYYGRAMDILPDTIAPSVWPVKIITEPNAYSSVLPTWRLIRERAIDVGGYQLVAQYMFDDMPGVHWKTHVARMRRQGVLYTAPQLSFLSVRKTPNFDAAEEKLQAALARFRVVTKLVESWPMYPVEHVRGPLKPYRPRSPRRRAALRDAGLLPDSDG